MTSSSGRMQQDAFAAALAGLLRQSRRQQGLTQAEVSIRTGGVVSKPALANYETGHRSLRVEIFWAITRALEEDPGDLFAAASAAVGISSGTDLPPIAVDVAAINASDDTRLDQVRRWFALRAPTGRTAGRRSTRGAAAPSDVIVLDQSALTALAALMNVSASECRQILADAAHVAAADAVTQAAQAAQAALVARAAQAGAIYSS